jgi:hypothetical protein
MVGMGDHIADVCEEYKLAAAAGDLKKMADDAFLLPPAITTYVANIAGVKNHSTAASAAASAASASRGLKRGKREKEDDALRMRPRARYIYRVKRMRAIDIQLFVCQRNTEKTTRWKARPVVVVCGTKTFLGKYLSRACLLGIVVIYKGPAAAATPVFCDSSRQRTKEGGHRSTNGASVLLLLRR